jgi:CDP-diacylglycerol--glycerol-3-phosphate 3-phosphatidyltransferase
MPSTYDLKQKFSGLLRPVANALVRGGVTANGVTWAALGLSVAYGALIYLRPATGLIFLLFPAVLLLRMALNNIDGVIAREHDQKTALGGYLNELSDVVSDLALYLPFARVAGFRPEAVLLFVLAGVVAEFAGVLAQAQGRPRSYHGPATKSDRALVMSLLSLAVYFDLDRPLILNGVLLLMTGLTLWSIINRVRYGTKAVAHV